ncbi:hypothetical protein [Haliangium ochraceum]|uniref:Uncharacterized protein n=1 Tax=Haliangium ochraceum (strain DSM 14365 / JCM 11303 / SMP-2) TaxID=502025 RepID=D0LZ43_HALO1|nr:hypothetical protein [Haliangium ochraceum]ACY16305.1 conserved hypothetical protein [Haliangium ochraceum DSM 14365]
MSARAPRLAAGRVAPSALACALLVASVLAGGTGAARADDGGQPSEVATSESAASESAAAEDAQPARVRPGVLPALGAVVPGVLVHGTGHRIAGDSATANRLLGVEAAAVGATVLGGVTLGLSGASRKLTLPALTLVVAGTSTILLNWAADIYGAAGGPGIAGAPTLALPALEAELSYLAVAEPQFAYTHFAVLGASMRRGRWHGGAELAVAMDDDNQRLRLGGARRLRGRAHQSDAVAGRADEYRDAAVADGSFLDLRLDLSGHRFGSDEFALLRGELLAAGRLDLVHLAPSLRGAFAELSLGLGLELAGYLGVGHRALDPTDWLLGGFGFGVYLGEPSGAGEDGAGAGTGTGALRLFYDHSRDAFAGGLAVPGGANGYLGSFGVDGVYDWSPRWGARVRVQAGSAYLAGIGLRFRLP